MSIVKKLGKFLGRHKKKKSQVTSDEEDESSRSSSQKSFEPDDAMDEKFGFSRKEEAMHYSSNPFKTSNIPPTEEEIKNQLLEADRLHKLWKIRRRMKFYNIKPTEKNLSLELDLSGPYKWDYIITCPPYERYILTLQYIRSLAAKEAIKSGYFEEITSETPDKVIAKMHKKYRLDFRINQFGQPINVCVGEDTTSSSESIESVIDAAKGDSIKTVATIEEQGKENFNKIFEKYTQKKELYESTSSLNLFKTANLHRGSGEKIIINQIDKNKETTELQKKLDELSSNDSTSETSAYYASNEESD